jgi:hypothetical protein
MIVFPPFSTLFSAAKGHPFGPPRDVPRGTLLK